MIFVCSAIWWQISDHDNYLVFVFISINATARITKCITSCSFDDFSKETGCWEQQIQMLYSSNYVISTGDRVSEWKYIHLKVLRMILSVEATAFRSCSAAFWHGSQCIRAGRGPVLKKQKIKIPFDIQDWRAQRKNWSDERKDCTGDMLRRRGHNALARFPKPLIRNSAYFTCLYVFPAKLIITAIIPVREMSTANTPSPSCKQIMLRGSWWCLCEKRNSLIAMMVPLCQLWVLSQQILMGAKLCCHRKEAGCYSGAFQMTGVSRCICDLFGGGGCFSKLYLPILHLSSEVQTPLHLFG